MSLSGNVNLLATRIGQEMKLTRLKVWGVSTLTDAVTVATDASLGSLFRVTVLGDRTFGIPTNPTDGQRIMYEITASGADRTVTFTTTGVGSFKYGTDFTAIPLITSGTTTYVGCLYSGRDSRWHIMAVGSGH